MTRGGGGLNIPLSGWAKLEKKGKKWGKKNERKKKEEKRKERLLLLSSFPEDPIVGVLRSKRQSSSSWREFQIETKI